MKKVERFTRINQKGKKQMSEQKQRVLGLDILRLFCIFFIVCLHTEILNTVFGINFEPICRFAVPCFFMITGFFYKNTVEQKKEVAQIKKVIILIVTANIMMILLNSIYYLSHNRSIVKWVQSMFSFEKVINCVSFNVNFITGHVETAHLWYLNALLYVLIIAFVFTKIGAFKVLFYLTPILLIGGLIIECFSEQLFGVNFKDTFQFYYYRNFLTIGIPYFCLGYLLNSIQYRIKLSTFLLFVFSVVFLAFSVVEMYLSNYFSLSSNGEFFITTPFCSACIFLLFLKYFENKSSKKIWNMIAVIGRKNVVWIYIFQYPIIIFIKDFFAKYSSALNNKVLVTILTLTLSLSIAIIVDKVIECIKSKNNQ